ncbi:hypothetical protein FRC03_005569 [Tulasnella sp. 419]|nr:hypothetical protein FRC03_005569 [Tulasnella sp. 419]
MVNWNRLAWLTLATQLVNAFIDSKPEVIWHRISPGWNLGNTLDAVPTEGSWNNPPVQAQTFDDIKATGFKSVRIPITWAHHFQSDAPDYNIDPVWMSRVETVVDQALQRGFWVVMNV